MGLAHNLGLILVLDMHIIDGAVAAGTRGRPCNLDFFIHRLRNRPVRLLSVRLPLFPSCPFRIGFGFAFGKRRRLPLRCSSRQIQFLLQPVSLLTKPILFLLDPLIFFLDALIIALESFILSAKTFNSFREFFDSRLAFERIHPAQHNPARRICPAVPLLTR